MRCYSLFTFFWKSFLIFFLIIFIKKKEFFVELSYVWMNVSDTWLQLKLVFILLDRFIISTSCKSLLLSVVQEHPQTPWHCFGCVVYSSLHLKSIFFAWYFTTFVSVIGIVRFNILEIFYQHFPHSSPHPSHHLYL